MYSFVLIIASAENCENFVENPFYMLKMVIVKVIFLKFIS